MLNIIRNLDCDTNTECTDRINDVKDIAWINSLNPDKLKSDHNPFISVDFNNRLNSNKYYQTSIKRLLDILIAGVALLLLSPLMLSVALLIKMESPGKCIFKQQRVGKNGKHFCFYKFRSMSTNCISLKELQLSIKSDRQGICTKFKNDPRVTKLGRILRKYSIDELPQLYNVLTGDMSLVGPRPAMVSEVDQYSLREKRRLAVMPGITGLWQVSGRADLDFEKQVELDVEYIETLSFKTDLKLLMFTIPAVIFCRGAY